MTDSTEPAGPSTVKRALLAVTTLQQRVAQLEGARTEPIAIIGQSCRWPGGVDSPEALWGVLRGARDVITPVPPSRWDRAAWYDPDQEHAGTMYVDRGGFVDAVDAFDQRFFRISPREAERLDPQQRLLLETAWEALERAGVSAAALRGTTTGVYLGLTTNDYASLLMAQGVASLDGFFFTGNPLNTAAGRLAYVLGLQGPALTIDTACSSSLVALHQACDALRRHECAAALVGAANLILDPRVTVAVSRTRALAPDGRCKTFSSRADGFVRSEGCAVLVLKRLSDAHAAGDPILAVVRGSAVNHDGASSGFTVPNGPAQQAVIRRALGDLPPASVAYLEAHGTGTALGDPIEVQAAAAVYGADRDTPLLLGSAKAHLGHCEAAAGLAGVMKVVLALQHELLPAQIHAAPPSPHIPWASLPVAVVDRETPWPRGDTPRRGAVSAFGASGTNAHVILEEAPMAAARVAPPAAAGDGGTVVFALAAQTPAALAALARRYAEALAAGGALATQPLHAIAAAVATARAPLPHRAAFVASDVGSLRAQLLALADAPSPGVRVPATVPTLAFLFTGQGAQYAGMGRRLYEDAPVFRETIDACDHALRGVLPTSLPELLWRVDRTVLADTRCAQPAIFAIGVALMRQLAAWGVRPDAVLGHSVGEFAAVVCAGSLTLEEAATLVAERGRLMGELPPGGAMAAVLAPHDAVCALVASVGDGCAVAGENGPRNTTVAGPAAAVEAVVSRARADGHRSIALDVSHAFHSSLIEPMLEAFAGAASVAAARPPACTWVSTRSGAVHRDAPDAAYWVAQAREPVRFASGIATLVDAGCRLFVEVGPRPTLVPLAQSVVADDDVAWGTTLHPDGDDLRHLHELLALLYTYGVPVDWTAVFGSIGSSGSRAVVAPLLPTYPFQRERCWLPDPSPMADARSFQAAAPPVSYRRQDILQALTADIAGALQMAPADVPADVPFLEMGADSIVMVEAIAIIEKRYGVKLALRQFFEELSTLDAVATHLDAALPSPVAAHTSAPTEIASPPAPPMAATAPMPTLSGDQVPLLQRALLEQQHLMSQFLANQSELLRAMSGASPAVGAAPPAPTPVVAGLPVPAATAPVAVPSLSAQGIAASHGPAAGQAKPMMPWGSGSETRKRGLSDQQATHLDALIARYTARTATSKAQAQRYRKVLADSRATVGFRLSTKELLYPISGARSDGSRLWDVDGNEYIDYTMGFGVHLLGHKPAAVQPIVADAFEQAVELGMRSDVVGEVAELLTECTGLERFAFTNSGTEAVMAAVRLARAKTGRDKLVIFSSAYHGHADITLARSAHEPGRVAGVPLVGGVPARQTDDVLVLEYGDESALEIIRRHAHDIAAVMVEPVQSRNPRLQPREFLQALRTLTREIGSALIFDEMITGFRAHLGGAQAYFGVQADLASYGKIIGGGLPIGAVGGTSEWMDGIDGGFWQYGDTSYPQAERTAFGGTFCQHPLSMAAARAVLRHLKAEGPALQETLNARTTRLVSTLNDFFRKEEVPITATHFSSLFRFEFSSNLDLLFYHMLEKGIYIWEWRSCFLSTAHSDADVDRFTTAMQETIDEMRHGGFVPPRATARTVPATPAQRQLVTAAALDPAANPAYQVRTTVALEGSLNVDALTNAVQAVVDRHSALRTSLPEDESDRQRIRPSVRMQLPIIDLTETPAARDAAIAAWREDDSRQPMPLGHGPLFRAALLRTSPMAHVLVLTAHHAIADGFTMGVILRDLAALYNAAVAGTSAAMPPVMQFEEYVRLSDAARDTPDMATHRAYWAQLFADGAPELQLPADRPRPALRSYRGAARHTVMPAEVVSPLRQLARRHGCSLHMTLTAAFSLLLHRISTQHDLVLGLPVLGRPFAGSMDMAGYCTHLLPLRSRLAFGSFTDHLAATRSAMLTAFDHQDLPFAALLDVVGARRAPDAPPLVSVVFNLEPLGAPPTFTALTGTLLPDVVTSTPFDVFVNVTDAGAQLQLEAQYNTDLFDPATIDGLLAAFRTLLTAVVAEPQREITSLPWLPEADAALLSRANATHVTYRHDTLTDLLAHGLGARAADPARASAPALVLHEIDGERTTWTAAALDARVNQLAHHLRDVHGVRPGMFVGVCAQRSAAMVLSVLAIIRAGGAYVPLDPSLPPARLAYQLADCGASIVLYPVHDGRADAAIGQALLWARTETPGFAAPRLVPVGDMPTSAEEAVAPTSAPASGIGASDPAYLIYTSGSSGRPKGAVNTHGGIANRLQWMQGQYGLSATDRVLQKTPFGFDVSVWEFFWPLITDATLIVARPDGHADAAYLVRCVGEMSVSTMHFVPSMLATWLAEPGVTAVAPGGGGSLRQVMASGEALPASVAIRWVRTMPGAALHNLYGPTEAAIDVSHWTVPVDFAGAVVPIGAPVANTTLHVLDAAGCAVPVGVPGELWIGGVQVGAGYHGRPALTAERFVPDPAHSGGRRYRTGDRVRWRRDGQLEFLGRLDDQVKLRGHRIELGEVESVLLSQPGIREAAVVVQEVVTGHPQLVAFVCGDGTGEAFDALALQRTLTAQLPAVMVPAHVVPMQALPRLASGKVDRRALPAVEAATGTEHDAPGSPTEAAMAAIWRAVLDRTVVGRHDNFFALGGDSLLAMQVLARITSTVRPGLSMRDFFLHPTVAALAACVPEADTAALPPLQPVVATASAPLSYEQRPWWVREQLGMAAAAPAPVAFRLDGALHVDALRMALLEVLGRHDILRTVFREVDGEVQQVVLAPESSTLSLPLTDRTGSDVSCLPDLAAALVEEPMRLDRGPLLRMHLVRLAADEHVLLCSMHHIIMDGVSLGVMAADLAAAYTATLAGEAPAWTPLAVQYRDVSHWQAALLSSPAAAAMVDYWRTHLADVPRLALPTDRPRRGARFARAQLTQTWTPELLQAVDAAAARTGSTRFVVLQSALKAMLHRESGQDDICIGTAVSTRVLPALEPQIGPHMNVLVLRDRVQPDDRFDALVARVRQTTVEGFGRRLVPFDLVVESLRQRREPGRQPVFDVGFTLQNQPSPVWPAGQGLTLTTLGDVLPTSGDAEALTDLWFIARPVGDSLAIDLVFNAALFSHATADRFLSNWQRLLTAAAEPSLVVGTVPLRRRPTRAATPAISIVLSTT